MSTTASTSTSTTNREKIGSSLAHLARAMKTPTIDRVWEQLADTAREQGWSYEEYLAAVLERQVADREANGTNPQTCDDHFVLGSHVQRVAY